MLTQAAPLAESPPTAFDVILAKMRDPGDAGFVPVGGDLEVLQHIERPFSELVRVRLASPTSSRCLYVKRYKPKGQGQEQWLLARDRVTRDYHASLRVIDRVGGVSGYAAVRPVACYPEDLALITEELPGETLTQTIERSARGWPRRPELDRLAAVLARVGGWIRLFQGERADQSGSLALASMREYLDVRLRKIVASSNDPFDEADRQRLLDWFDRVAAQVAGSELIGVPVHADLCPANVLVHAGTIAVIDFAMASTGGLYLDLARMYTQLEFMQAKPWFRRQVIAELQRALLRGYDPLLRPDRPLFALFLLQHTMTQFLKLTLRPGRSTARMWNGYVRQRHRRWIHRLTSRGHARLPESAGSR